MDKLTQFKVDPKRFAIYKESVREYVNYICNCIFIVSFLQYIRNLKNFSMEQPYQHAVYYLTVLLTEHSWTKKELLAAVDRKIIRFSINIFYW